MAKNKPVKQNNKDKKSVATPVATKVRKVYAKVPNRSGCGKKRQPMSGFGVEHQNREVGSFQRTLKAEHDERELRKELAAEAALHPVVQEIRDNVTEIRAMMETLSSERKAQSERTLHRLTAQLIEIDEAFIAFGFKSNVTGLMRKDAILKIRMSNGYLRRIVRDALFGALREHRFERELASDAMAS